MDFVPLLERGQAGADGSIAVQIDEAVKARTDPAKEPPPLATRSRRPPCPLAVGQQSSCDCAAAGSHELSTVETEPQQRQAS